MVQRVEKSTVGLITHHWYQRTNIHTLIGNSEEDNPSSGREGQLVGINRALPHKNDGFFGYYPAKAVAEENKRFSRVLPHLSDSSLKLLSNIDEVLK